MWDLRKSIFGIAKKRAGFTAYPHRARIERCNDAIAGAPVYTLHVLRYVTFEIPGNYFEYPKKTQQLVCI